MRHHIAIPDRFGPAGQAPIDDTPSTPRSPGPHIDLGAGETLCQQAASTAAAIPTAPTESRTTSPSPFLANTAGSASEPEAANPAVTGRATHPTDPRIRKDLR